MKSSQQGNHVFFAGLLVTLVLFLQPKACAQPGEIVFSFGPECLLHRCNVHVASTGVQVTQSYFDPAP